MNTEPGHCSNALLQEYSDGVLSGEALRNVAAHLASCAPCRRSAAALRRLDEALRRLPQETSDVRFTRSVMDGIETDPAYRLLVWAGAAAGMTVVAGLVLAILFATGVLDPGVAMDQEAPGLLMDGDCSGDGDPVRLNGGRTCGKERILLLPPEGLGDLDLRHHRGRDSWSCGLSDTSEGGAAVTPGCSNGENGLPTWRRRDTVRRGVRGLRPDGSCSRVCLYGRRA